MTNERYVGIRSFQGSEADIFYGRTADIYKLSSLVFVNQLTVVCGKSGYGKTSIVNAGLVPSFQREDLYTIFRVRFSDYGTMSVQKSPLENVKNHVNQSLTRTEERELIDSSEIQESLWYLLKLAQYENPQHRFVFLFDQFEELFSYSKSDICEFSAALADILYTPVPKAFCDELYRQLDRGIITEELYDFLYKAPVVKVIPIIRADGLSLLDELSLHHPTILLHLFKLGPLTLNDAAEAITGPAARIGSDFRSPPFKYSEEAINLLLSHLSDQQGMVNPFQLQLICASVEDKVIWSRQTLVTPDLIGSVSDVIMHYYENILQKLPAGERYKVQSLIEEEFIIHKQRVYLPEIYVQSKFGLSDYALHMLIDNSFLRKEVSSSGGVSLVISEDLLVESIVSVFQSRIKREKREARKIKRIAVTFFLLLLLLIFSTLWIYCK